MHNAHLSDIIEEIVIFKEYTCYDPVSECIADKDDTLVIETGSDRTRIRFRRSAISSVEKLDTGKDSKSTPVKK